MRHHLTRARRALTLRASFALVAFIVLALVAPGAVRAAEPTVVSVGATPGDTSAVVFFAQDLGYFRAAGLDVRIQTMTSGVLTAGAVASNALDIGLASVGTMAAAYLHGIPLRYIAPAAVASPQTLTDLMMVAKASPIQKAADLNGKTIALNGLKNLQQICAMAWVDKHGGNSKTLKFIEMPESQMAVALEQNRVAAAMMVEPFVSSASATTRSLGDALDGVGTTFLLLGFISTDSWLAAHADAAASFASAIDKAAVWANAHGKESTALLLRHLKLKLEIASTMARPVYGTRLEASLLQPVIDDALKYGIIDKLVPAADLIWTGTKGS
ncbi:MAG TPA: ABC transporter substrate-binding protein [Candidatus Baltobacteraceae bacterium]|nr:ABC transporter substrate-binding protein [Candidatus Baltobacteraceae bacterium]